MGIIVIPLIIYRLVKIGEVLFSAKPSSTILCAPTSLLLAGYMSSFLTPLSAFSLGMMCLSQLLYVIVMFNLPGWHRGGFRPSYSAFTFPLVITATSLKLVVTNPAFNLSGLMPLVLIEEAIATAAVFYVLVRYALHWIEVIKA